MKILRIYPITKSVRMRKVEIKKLVLSPEVKNFSVYESENVIFNPGFKLVVRI